MTKAYLVLENGIIFEGESVGAQGTAKGEVVFNTSMTGYQEILTDPSYKGQIVLMTYPQIGNYGINSFDIESENLAVEGFIIKELSPVASNFRSEDSLGSYLEKNSIVAIAGIDTRYLTKILRNSGSLMGMITTDSYSESELLEKSRYLDSIEGKDFVQFVTCRETYAWDKGLYKFDFQENKPKKTTKRFKLVVYDFGTKRNILRQLCNVGFEVTVVNAYSSFKYIKSLNPDAIFLSNGPGDPRGISEDTIRELRIAVNEYPTFGICFGLQIIARIFGAEIYKLKFGHHGANHPVKNLLTKKIEITVQNHNYAATSESIEKCGFEITHQNLNDYSVEGIKHKTLPIFAVQYHPEASAGPHDSEYLFEKFYRLVENGGFN